MPRKGAAIFHKQVQAGGVGGTDGEVLRVGGGSHTAVLAGTGQDAAAGCVFRHNEHHQHRWWYTCNGMSKWSKQYPLLLKENKQKKECLTAIATKH